MEDTLINKVALSDLKTLNLEDFYPSNEMLVFDLKDHLFHGLILKEKDFRLALQNLDWENHRGKITLIYCSTDAIIPLWAYMLISSYLQKVNGEFYIGNKEEYLNHYYTSLIHRLDLSQYTGQRIVIKGCSNKPVPAGAYAQITSKLQPVALSIMFGEPCSTVPIFKKPKSN